MRKDKGEVFDEEGEGMGWSPPKLWTAWPLAPEDVPRTGEIVGEDDGEDLFAFKRVAEVAPSRELEEVLVGITLRFARERYEGRESEGGAEVDADEDGVDEVMDDLDGEENSPEAVMKEHSELPEPKTWLRPIISADDERSAFLLRSSIRHNLLKLDEVLMALHYARKTCHQVSSRSAANTDDESVASASPNKRGPGRPRKYANLALLQKEGETPVHSSSDPFRAKKTHIGRPQKVYSHLDGETQQEYLIRIARIQKKPLPSFAEPAPTISPRSPSVTSSGSRKSPARRGTSEGIKISRQKKLGLRDWSEILGSAALVGFSPDVIARATQRCADLFGEGMAMRTLIETPFVEKNVDFATTYQPKEIPDFGEEGESSDDSTAESEIETSRDTFRSRKRKARIEVEDESWFCPVEICRKQGKGFEFISELRRHMENIHKMGGNEIDGLLDNDEMDGAVHNDGFLEPVRYRQGVRGEAQGPRKKGKSGSKFSDVSDTGKLKSDEEDGGSSSGELDDEHDRNFDEDGLESL
jgi:hypothetical protein